MKIKVNGEEKKIELDQENALLSKALILMGYKPNTIVVELNDLIINSMKWEKVKLKDGCDYIGIGPVFETATKKSKKPIGIEKIKTLTKDLNIPWFAIGGIKKNNISYLKSNGFKKFALVSQLMNSENPKEDAIMILKELSHEN